MIRTNKSPKVCIRCITYNHEAYIRDCLEGFVMQKTNFPYIAIVHDDASTDGTASIIREYAERYPDIIKPIYEVENQYSKPDNLLGKLMNKACLETGASYIAMCEGDDYWTDPHKLQKQVDFLESHPDYSLVFHNVDIFQDWTGNQSGWFNILEKREYTISEVLEKWIIPTCSALYNSKVLKIRPYDNDFFVGDNIIWATCNRIGKIFCIPETMGVYRQNLGGWTFRKRNNIDIHYKMARHYNAMIRNFPDIPKEVLENLIIRNYLSIVMYYTVQKDWRLLQAIHNGCKMIGYNFSLKVIQHYVQRILFHLKKLKKSRLTFLSGSNL